MKRILVRLFFRFFILFAVSLFILVFSKGWQMVTEGFRLDKIEKELPVSNNEEIDPSILQILSQDFYYLGKGCQVYVFESKDKQYVLKLMRYHKYRLPFWLDQLSFFSWGEKYRLERRQHRKKSYAMTMDSYHIADNILKEETGVIHIHLQKTKGLPQKLQLIDRLHRRQTIDINHHGFILQKRLHNLESVITRFKKKKDLEQIEKTIDSFLQTIVSIYKKGVVIRDYNCLKNAGYIEGNVIEMDVGSLYPAETDLSDPQAFEKELRNFTKHFRKWSVKHFPTILPLFDQKVQEVVDNHETLWNQ